MDIVTKVKPEERGLIYEYRRSLVKEYLLFPNSSMVLDKKNKSTNLYPHSLYHHVCGHPGLPVATSAVRLPVSDFAEAMLSPGGS